MAYAETEDLTARAGGVASAWTERSRPSLRDLDRFIDDAAFLIDAVLAARGHTVPVSGAAAEALREPNAVLALRTALRATPGAGHPDLRTQVEQDADDFWAAMSAGTHPAIMVLTPVSAGPPSASDADSLWSSGGGEHAVRSQTRLYDVYPTDVLRLRKGMVL